jgi:hypothetical protein
MAVAKQRAIDLFRRSRLIGRKHEQLGYELQIDEAAQPDLDAALMTTSATISCASSSYPATRSSRPRRARRSRCACSAA